MSSSEAHVENSIWMRAVLMGSTFLIIGILAFATMGVGMANIRHHDWDEAVHHYEDAKHDYDCLLYTSPSPRDRQKSRMPSSA